MTMLLSSLAVQAQEEQIIRFHTNIPAKAKSAGIPAQVSFVLGASDDDQTVSIDCGSGDQEFDVKKAIIGVESGEQTIKGSLFTGTVTDEGWVTITGDPTNIYYFNASGNEIDSIEFSKNLRI